MLQNKNLLITGGAGFIGSNIASELADGNQIRILDNMSTGKLSNFQEISDKIDLINSDIRKNISNHFEDIDIVFHEAANISINKSIKNPIYDAESNIIGTLNILEACRKHGVKRLVFASSCAVYGDPIQIPISEEHPLNPKTPYAIGKMACEYYCKVYNELYGLETVSLRYFNVYGKNQSSNNPYSGVIAIFIDSALKNKPFIVYGDGKQTRDFINVKDVVRANIFAATSKKVVGKIINIGTGKKTSLNTLISMIEEIIGKKLMVQYKSARIGDIKHSCADITFARNVLDFEPSVDLKEGIELTREININ